MEYLNNHVTIRMKESDLINTIMDGINLMSSLVTYKGRYKDATLKDFEEAHKDLLTERAVLQVCVLANLAEYDEELMIKLVRDAFLRNIDEHMPQGERIELEMKLEKAGSNVLEVQSLLAKEIVTKCHEIEPLLRALILVNGVLHA